jgi:hypothetical protein
MSSTSPLLPPLDQTPQQAKRTNHGTHKPKTKSKSKPQHGSTVPAPDQIDALDDVTGVFYHHDGPYEATLAARNRDPRTAPVAAVREGNLAALRATPAVNVVDAVTRRVPLQGTASVPPGEVDFTGNVMDYEEGPDVMREPDAAGGAYRRYEGVVSFFFTCFTLHYF